MSLEIEVRRVFRAVIQFASTIELSGDIEVPDVHRRFVRQRQQSFVARCQRTQTQLAVVCRACIVEAEGGGGAEALDERICGIYLCRMAAAGAVQIAEIYTIGSHSSVYVYDHLVGEARVVVFGI